MTILIFFAIVLVTIVLAIFINRLVRCPLLVGLIFFSITLLVAIILSNITLVILAIILGFIAFMAAFLDCVFKSSRFFRNNRCLRCHNPFDDDEDEEEEEDDDDDCRRRRRRRRRRCDHNNNGTLRIINNNGEVIARIRGNTIRCFDDEDNNNNCGCNGRRGSDFFLAEPSNENVLNTSSDVVLSNESVNNTSSSCGCGRRYRR